jgi:hypothetical protein
MLKWKRAEIAASIKLYEKQLALALAFDLFELDGEDLRHEPIEVGKTTLIAYGSLDRHVGMSRGDARERDRRSARWADDDTTRPYGVREDDNRRLTQPTLVSG